MNEKLIYYSKVIDCEMYVIYLKCIKLQKLINKRQMLIKTTIKC